MHPPTGYYWDRPLSETPVVTVKRERETTVVTCMLLGMMVRYYQGERYSVFVLLSWIGDSCYFLHLRRTVINTSELTIPGTGLLCTFAPMRSDHRSIQNG